MKSLKQTYRKDAYAKIQYKLEFGCWRQPRWLNKLAIVFRTTPFYALIWKIYKYKKQCTIYDFDTKYILYFLDKRVNSI